MKSHPVAVTVDIEDWYHVPSVTGSTFSVFSDVDTFFAEWNGRFDYLSAPTGRLLSILDDFEIKATFFIIADTKEHYPGLIESIAERGHEIACHGLHHTCVIDSVTKKPVYSEKTFSEEITTAKQILERISKKPVKGFRSPNAFIAGWMLDILEDLGFSYDSSVSRNSFYNKSDSDLKGVTSVPYYPKKGRLEPGPARTLVEFPWANLEIGGIQIPTSGGPMLRFLPVSVMKSGIKQSLKRGPTVFYLHPIDLSDEPFPRVGKGRPFYWLKKGKNVEKKLISLLQSLDTTEKRCLEDIYMETV
jgi:peptidoglycan/xylan/chitin deacetylase (PgdA/CDA1 family)